ncbi:MAG TPA: hypothetical protein VKE40_09580 [Gemmataceae bacterium]|nr:hypothetical protein [Gemmataceae bacterium]
MSKAAIEEETEKFRQLVIAARQTATVEAAAKASVAKLNALYRANPKLFTEEDVRWLNVLQATLGARLAALRPNGTHARLPKRKGDRLDHCWRCEAPVDDRFTEICPECDSKAYHWRICPFCKACGCQRSGKVMV